jgi:glycosyltransferase involved in cell wall biosynthesis
MSSLCVVILTYNEEMHIERCLKSVLDISSRIIIVDSVSTDGTKEIVEKFDVVDYIPKKWLGCQSDQLNWLLDNVEITEDWILRLDADEYLLPQLKFEIADALKEVNFNVNGFFLKRRVYFMDKWIRFGGYYPILLLRLWRNGKGYWDGAKMDEHFILHSGTTGVLKNDFVDHNLNDLSWWISKHNDYSSREVINYFSHKENYHKNTFINKGEFGNNNQVKRKYNLYYRLPIIYRSIFYFIYRYFFLLGFRDGYRGFIWHFLQGLWYRLIVDVKILQKKE